MLDIVIAIKSRKNRSANVIDFQESKRKKKPLTETFPLFLEKKIIYAQFEEAQSISF